MKVFVVGLNYAPEPTGIAPYTAGLCRDLVARGHLVHALTAMPHYPEWRIRQGYEGSRRLEVIDGVRVRRLRHYVPRRPSGVRRLLSEISFGVRAMVERWGGPDVVVLVSPALFSSALAAVRARIQRVPYVLWVQDIYTSGIVETTGSGAEGTVARIIRFVESRVMRSAASVAVIHDRFADVIEEFGVDGDRIGVVRNWTHLSPDRPQVPNVGRAAFGWGEDEVVALHSGAMGHKQDLRNVVAAARVAEERGSNVHFVLVGDGSEREELQAAAEGVGSISFVDPLPGEQYREALDLADVLIVNEHAGLRDMAVPSKLTSYFSSGHPVVAATDASSVTASEIEASRAGVRVDPGCPEALLDAVVALGDEKDLSDELGRNGQRYRTEVLSENGAVDRFETLLERVAAPGAVLTARPSA